jgi:hypothetical protein
VTAGWWSAPARTERRLVANTLTALHDGEPRHVKRAGTPQDAWKVTGVLAATLQLLFACSDGQSLLETTVGTTRKQQWRWRWWKGKKEEDIEQKKKGGALWLWSALESHRRHHTHLNGDAIAAGDGGSEGWNAVRHRCEERRRRPLRRKRTRVSARGEREPPPPPSSSSQTSAP